MFQPLPPSVPGPPGPHWETKHRRGVSGPLVPCGTACSPNLEHPLQRSSLSCSVLGGGKRGGGLEGKLSTGVKGEEAGLSAGCSQFCCVFIFKLWRGEEKSQWVFAFISISFHSFFPLLYKDGLYLSKEKQEERVL